MTEINDDKVKKIAERYGLEVDFIKPGGLYIGDQEIDIYELFPELELVKNEKA
jgi:hypothetical protein